MKSLILCLLLLAVWAQDFVANKRKTTSGLDFDNGDELLRYMHIKQHKMGDHYVKQVGTIYVFYSDSPKDPASQRDIEKWRQELHRLLDKKENYIDIEEIIVDDQGYDVLLSFYNTSIKELKERPLVLIDEFDEKVWVYTLNQTSKISDRIKSVLTEGISYFNY